MNYTPILTWWFVIFIFGLIGWPLAFSLLRFLPDRGFALARPVGLLITGYLLWLGGSFRLMQNNIGGIITAMLLTLIAGLVWQRHLHHRDDSLTLLAWLQREWRYALTVELLFAVAFGGWAIFKAYNPNIETAGGEKWMEITFINGTLRSDYFPPHDPWLAGFAISYYYFGYVLMAMVTRLSGLVSHVAFNLYVPTLFAMTLTAALGIGANLVQLSNFKFQISNPDSAGDEDDSSQHSDLTSEPQIPGPAMLTGLLAALFVGIMGHLEGFLEVLHRRGLLSAEFWRWLDIRDLKVPPAGPGDSWLPDRFMWWWRGSRVLTDYTLTGHEQEVIDEFPFFSFLLADVHPHVLALPFVLLAVTLALNLFANPAALPPVDAVAESIIDKIKQSLQNTWRMLTTAAGGSVALLVYAVCIGGLSFLNTWDFPIYLGILGLSFMVWLFGRRPNWSAALQTGLTGTVMLGLGGILLYLPFYATFQSQARGILPNLWNPTRLPQFLIFFGPFLAAILIWLLMMSVRQKGWQKYIGLTLPFTILGPLMLMLTVLSGILISPTGREFVEGLLNNPEVQNILGDATISALVQESLWRRFQNPWVFLLLGGLLGWALALGLADNHADADIAPKPANNPVIKFVLILLLVGLALPLAVEFMYLRDNFGIRMNTVFKFYFQAWVLLALVSAFAMYYVSQQLQGARRLGWRIGMDLLIAAGMVYPLLATADKTNYFGNEPTLNGIQWIADQRPDDFAGMAWLRANAPDNAIILEAPGSKYAAYQYTGRVSALTGLQTLLGWGGHQSQWRGNYDEPARREPDIDTLFNTVDARQAQTLLDKYGIDYVYIGPLERERYAPAGLQKFERLMNIAFQQNNVTIYQR